MHLSSEPPGQVELGVFVGCGPVVVVVVEEEYVVFVVVVVVVGAPLCNLDIAARVPTQTEFPQIETSLPSNMVCSKIEFI